MSDDRCQISDIRYQISDVRCQRLGTLPSVPPSSDIRLCHLSSIRLQLLGNLGNAGLGAGLVAGLARPADAYGPDGVVADVDRNATAQRDHVGELALCP